MISITRSILKKGMTEILSHLTQTRQKDPECLYTQQGGKTNKAFEINDKRIYEALARISGICFVAIPIGRSTGTPAQVSNVVSRSP